MWTNVCRYSFPADVWSLGCILMFRCSRGNHLFQFRREDVRFDPICALHCAQRNAEHPNLLTVLLWILALTWCCPSPSLEKEEKNFPLKMFELNWCFSPHRQKIKMKETLSIGLSYKNNKDIVDPKVIKYIVNSMCIILICIFLSCIAHTDMILSGI